MNASSSVANRPLSLASHLRRVAYGLKTNALGYDWTRTSKCNCGLVACSIMGITPDFLNFKLNLHQGVSFSNDPRNTWTSRAKDFCPISGEPVDTIFKKLTAAGLTFSDFHELEFLSNPEVLKQMDGAFAVTTKKKRWLRSPVDVQTPLVVKKNDRLSLQAYLETWATMIEEFNAKSVEAALDAIEDRPLVATT